MNSYQISKILAEDARTSSIFIGVFARNEIPTINKYPSCFILNTHNRNQPGEHWLAIYFDRNGKGEFFDSMGLHPKFYGLEKYLDKISTKQWIYNTKKIQGFFSNLCGIYCLFFIYFRCRNFSLYKITSFFGSDYDKNDKKVYKIIKKYF